MRPATTREAAAGATRRALIDAAADLIAARGPTAASVKAITERSNVSRGLIGWHFGSKDQLVVEVVDRSMGELESALRRATSESAPFEAVSAAFVVAAATVSGRVVLTTLAHVLSRRDVVAEAYDRGVRRLIEAVAEVAAPTTTRTDLAAAEVAGGYVAAMLAFGLQLVLDPELDSGVGLAIGTAFDRSGVSM